MRGAVGLIVVSLLVAAGCTLGSSQPAVGCQNVPSAACDEQFLQVAAGLSGVESVEVVCGDAAPCTRAGGSGLAEIRFSNGQKVSRPWSYVGDAGPPPVVTCVGIAAGPCHSGDVVRERLRVALEAHRHGDGHLHERTMYGSGGERHRAHRARRRQRRGPQLELDQLELDQSVGGGRGTLW